MKYNWKKDDHKSLHLICYHPQWPSSITLRPLALWTLFRLVCAMGPAPASWDAAPWNSIKSGRGKQVQNTQQNKRIISYRCTGTLGSTLVVLLKYLKKLLPLSKYVDCIVFMTFSWMCLSGHRALPFNTAIPWQIPSQPVLLNASSGSAEA